MSLNKIAKIAGILILITVFLGPFSMVYVPTTLVVAGEASATARNIQASEGLFRAALASDALIFLIEIGLTALVYALIKPVNETLALMAAFARLAMTVVQGLNLLNHFVALLLLGGAGYLAAFEPAQVQALALLFLNAHDYGVYIWGLFFGLHLLLLGYLVYQSGYLPRWLGFVLVVVAVCYFTQSFGLILWPQYKSLFTTIGTFAFLEVVFPVWLLIKTINPPTAKRAGAYQQA